VSSSLRRGALAAVLAVTIVPLAAACGTGSDPQTLEIKPDSVATSVGDVSIQNAYIVTEPQGAGSGPAAITARVFNNGDAAQTLDSISVQGASGQVTIAKADGASGPLTIPAHGSVTLGGKGNPSAQLADSTGVVDGDFQNTVFDFSRTGQVAIAPSVVPAKQFFSSYGPTAPASPSPTGGAAFPSTSASGSPSGSPVGLASGSPSASTGAKTGTTTGTTTGAKKSGAPNQPVASTTPKA
jgi:hypothetical protein